MIFALALGLLFLLLCWWAIKNQVKVKPSIILKILAAILLLFFFFRIGQPILAFAISTLVFAATISERIKQLLLFGRWIKSKQQKAEEGTTATVTAAKMSRQEALEVLGLEGNPSSEEINQAYNRLMKKLHPDTGGSDYLAQKLNQARDILNRKRRK